MSQKKISWLTSHSSQTGGNWVSEKIKSGLSDEYSITTCGFDYGSSLPAHLLSAARFATYDEGSVDLWIENPFTIASKLPRTRNNSIIVCHHIHYPHPENSWYTPSEVGRRIKNELFLKRARKAKYVVVGSNYWKEFLQEKGLTNIRKACYGLPVDDFEFNTDTIRDIKLDLNANNRPLIHLGIPANLKGTDEAFERLKNMEAKFITTGRQDYELPVEHLNPSYRQYLHILAACDVVISMSKFEEGWGLFVHEAMLAGTPVVGSGRGGMGELLQGGNQVICNDFTNLRSCVEYALKHRDSLAQSGREFAQEFTLDQMINEWREILKDAV